ncbi:MAG: Cys-tRNA(Pro) deacylase [Eubacteriales bacterium]|nr:Cys-tRNA(Pro) deacylase [Eubacteriales bacterium]
MAKEVKTNAMRILDKNKISYELITYECDEFIDGLHTAAKTGAPVEQSFKTLVAQGKSKAYYVFVVPIAEEVDLKLAAKTVGEKSVEMIHVKDINAVTGYIRGGCTPIGMKKSYPVFIQESARNYAEMYVSGGRIGSTLKLSPSDLQRVTNAVFADFIVRKE